jgi:hypothetical protein
LNWTLNDAGDWVKKNSKFFTPESKSPLHKAYNAFEHPNLTFDQRKSGYTGPFQPANTQNTDFKSYISSGGIGQRIN